MLTSPESIKDDWLRLTGTGRSRPFQTYGWVSAWYDTAERLGIAEALIVAGSRRPDHRPEIILPLCRYRRFGTTFVSAPDLGVSDHYRPIASQDLEEEPTAVSDFLVAALEMLPAHDLLLIGKFEGDGPDGRPRLVRDRHLAKMPISAWSLSLSGDQADTAMRRFTPKLRQGLRRKITNMEKTAKRTVKHFWRFEDDEVFESIWNMRADRLEATGRGHAVDRDPWFGFYKDIVGTAGSDLQPYASILYCNDAPVASQFGVIHNNSFFGLLLSFSMGAYDRFSPGLQILLESICELEARGITHFDLSIGDQPYKRRFGCTARPLYEVMIPASRRGSLIWAGWRVKRFLRRYRLASDVLRRLRQLPPPARPRFWVGTFRARRLS